MKGKIILKKVGIVILVHRIACSGSAYFLYGTGTSSEIH